MTPTQRAAALRLADELDYENHKVSHDAADLLRELAAEPVHEPVAYIDPRQLAAGYVTLLCITRPEYRSYADVAEGIHYTPVYLHPAQQRKPLTDDEALALIRATPQEDVTQEGWIRRQRLSWVRAIERAHGITGEPT